MSRAWSLAAGRSIEFAEAADKPFARLTGAGGCRFQPTVRRRVLCLSRWKGNAEWQPFAYMVVPEARISNSLNLIDSPPIFSTTFRKFSSSVTSIRLFSTAIPTIPASITLFFFFSIMSNSSFIFQDKGSVPSSVQFESPHFDFIQVSISLRGTDPSIDRVGLEKISMKASFNLDLFSGFCVLLISCH